MNIYDFLAKGYYKSFDVVKGQQAVNKLLCSAEAKGRKTFSHSVVKNQMDDEHLVNKMVLSRALTQYMKTYPSLKNYSIDILLRERNILGASLEKKNEYVVVFLDDIFIVSLMDIICILIYWNVHNNDSNLVEECYSHLFYVLDSLCKQDMSSEKKHNWHNEFMVGVWTYEEKIVHLMSDMFLAVQTFIVNHELSHLVLGHSSNARNLAHEILADKLAYEQLCRMIVESQDIIQSQMKPPEDEYLFPYTYLAAPILFDIYLLIIQFRKGNRYEFPSIDADALTQRKARLMHIPDSYDIDSHDGNIVYYGVLNSIDCFIEIYEDYLSS